MISLNHLMNKLNELTNRLDQFPKFEWGWVVKTSPLTVKTDIDSTHILGASLIGKASPGDRVRIERQGSKTVVWAVGRNAFRKEEDFAPEWTSVWRSLGSYVTKEIDRFVFKDTEVNSHYQQIFSPPISLENNRTYKLTFTVTNRGSSAIKSSLWVYNTKQDSPNFTNYVGNKSHTIPAGDKKEVDYTFTVDYSQYPGSNSVLIRYLADTSTQPFDYSVDGVSLVDITDARVDQNPIVYHGAGATRQLTTARFGDVWHDTDGLKRTWKGASNGKWRLQSVELTRPSSGWDISQHPVYARTDSFNNITDFWLESNEYLLMEVTGAGNGFEFSSLVSYTSNENTRTTNVVIRKLQVFSAAHQISTYRLRIMDN